MAVSSINNNSGAGGTGTGSSAADLSNQFMTLLVAQMKNPDPTNPMDNNQLTSAGAVQHGGGAWRSSIPLSRMYRHGWSARQHERLLPGWVAAC